MSFNTLKFMSLNPLEFRAINDNMKADEIVIINKCVNKQIDKIGQ